MIDAATLEQHKRDLIFKPLESADDMREWMSLYFNIYFPSGVVYPTSTHGPVESMWRIYELFKTNQTTDVPQVVMVASRDSYKTLSAAAIEVLIFLHFRLPLAHAAAIKFQAGACVNYVNTFFRKVRPYLEYHGWTKVSDNKMLIEWRTGDGEDISLTVLTATKAGMNSRHVPFLVLDELDLMDPAAFKESRMVPSVYKGYSPLILILSTRKFASGLMESEINKTPTIGGEVFRWNILDVTERIPKSLARVDEPLVPRYITSKLPMRNITPEVWETLSDDDKNKFERFEAYAGIAEHKMLPVMKHYLVERPEQDYGFLYKPLTATHNNFKVTDTEIADAQLLCNKPSSAGLVYGRFEQAHNVMTPTEALERFTGEKHHDVTVEYLRDYLLNLGITFIGGGDWGFTDYTNLPVLALLPNGEIWMVDNFFENQLELDDIVVQMTELQKKWNITRWFVEQAYPGYLVTMRRHGLRCPEFTKVVEDGITALKTKIVNSGNSRKFFIIRHPNTERAIQSFGEYRWSVDSKGDIIEGKPYHDKDGVSDIMDSIRYPMQNLFNKAGKLIFTSNMEQAGKKVEPTVGQVAEAANQNLMLGKIKELAPQAPVDPQSQKAPKKRIMWM